MTQATPLPALRINPHKCYTAQAWAKKEKMNLRTVYRRIEQKEIGIIKISGVVFIYED